MGWLESNTSRDPVAEEGMRIRIIHMDDDNGVDEGMEGTITKIDSLGTLHVRWDDGRQLGVIYGIDDYQLLPKVEDQTTPDNFMNLFGESKLTSNLKRDFKTSIRKNRLKIKVENTVGVNNMYNIKDDVKRILSILKTANPQQKMTLDNLVKNLINKYKNHKKDENKFQHLIQQLTDKISDKLGIDETTTASAIGSAPIQPLGSKGGDYITKQKNINGDIKNPSGIVYPNESKKDIEEATTFSSVFGGDFPVTPFMFAKKGKHVPSKRTIWKGGKIVQKIDRADILGESILDEINKVKWVKGGKYVKIKDRCSKYNNKSWCSQGALDNPLELSDTTFENIKIVSKKLGISEQEIINKILENNNLFFKNEK